MMLIPSENILLMREYMLQNGCITIEDTPKGLHPRLNIPNKQVINYLRHLVSKECAKKTFIWRHGYYFMTDKGVETLRAELFISEPME